MVQLLLYDATGQIVLRKIINGTRAEIDRQEISAGLYICHVVENGVVICTNKFVVQYPVCNPVSFFSAAIQIE